MTFVDLCVFLFEIAGADTEERVLGEQAQGVSVEGEALAGGGGDVFLALRCFADGFVDPCPQVVVAGVAEGGDATDQGD
jgi:hypothetical protein